MNLYKRTRRFLAAILSVVIVLGLIPTTGKASAATTMVKVVQIAAAQNNSIALKSDGTVFAWGNNVTSWAKPPEGLTDVVEIYAKDTVFLARKSNGTVVVWGSNEASETTIPNGLNNVISMASAGHHTLMVSKSGVISGAGTAVAWGLNGNGQSDVPVDAQAAVTKVAAGSYYSMALKINGTVVDWGTNGLGSTLKPADLSNVVAIDAGYMYALALKSDGTVAAWGKEYDENGILNVSGLTGITAISANSTHALALKSDGTVVGWGDNKYGKATPPVGLTDVVAISAGVDHSLALKSDGTVVSWGLQTSVPGNNELSSLTISEGTSNIAFDPSVTSYQYDISPYETSVHIDAVLKDTASSELYINDQLQKSGSTVAVAVPATGAVIKILVKPYLKESRTYTLTISRDREPPSVTFSPNGSSTTPLRTISTSVKVTDTTSGVDPSTLEYAWSQAASAPASGWANFSLIPYTQLAQFTHAGADGNWYLHIRAKDYTGKLAEVSSEPFLIDNTAPVLSLTMKKADDTAYLEDSWSNQAVVISAAAIDAQSANVTVKYTLDGGKTWTSYTDPITIPDSGIYTVIIQASDAIGNVQTESRTIRITEGDLKLTITKVKVTGGDDYSSGDWTNSSVRVTATAETKAGETILADSFTWDMNEVDMGKYSGQQIFFFTDGMNSGEFKVKDSLGNSLTAPYAVNIDRTAPTVSFSPNGNAALAREASVTATVADSGGSGLVESALEYVWTQSTGEPTDGWLPLNNGSTLTKEGVDGNWYLHIRGKDAAGNEINAVSSPFVLDNAALNSTLSPDTGSFDKKESAQADVDTMLMLNGNTLVGISNGTDELLPGMDYVITGNTVVIQKSYLILQPEGAVSLTFTFSGGSVQTLTITIDDTTPLNSTISPDIASFDKKISAQADVDTTLTLNGNTLTGISNDGIALVSGTDYSVSGDVVTILKNYLASQPLGVTSLTFTFSSGAIQTLIFMISDTTPSNSTISPNAGSFDKKTSAQADIDTTLTLNGNTLTGISNGAETLVLGTDYTVTGNTVTLLKSYLAVQAVGTTSLTFTFSGGANQTLTITVNDTTPQNSTISPNAGSFNKKVSAQADVSATLTLNGNTLIGISNGAGTLVLGTDYTVTGNTVTILKSYLAEQAVGTTSLTFTFSGGANQTLTITVNDTTPQNSTISPNAASFDKKTSVQADVSTTLTLSGNTLIGISNGAETLVLGTDYTVTGNTVTLLKSYLAAQAVGTTSLTFTFSGGADQTLAITVNDTTPQNSTISPNAGSFNKKVSAQADVDTTLTLNGNTLIGISNGAETLVLGTDYTVTGNTVTILKSYLAEQSVGATSLTFTFSGGADQTLTITVNDTTPQNSTVSPNVASFDKKVSAQADVDTTLTLNGNTLTGISNGAETLVLGTDYTVTGNTVTILKSYLAEQSVGSTSLTFTFSGGADQTLTITVNDTTPQNSTVSPNVASFDKKVSAQADVDTTLTLNGNTLIGISNGAETLVLGTDYTVTGNTVTILKSYLAEQSVGATSLTFTFSGGADQTLTITVNDTTPQNSTVSPNVASFDKKVSAQADVDTTLTLNGNTLTGISNGAETLVLGTDYTVTGNTVTILKSYLAEQSVGATSLTFTFSGGADQTLTITVNDTTPQNSTVSPNVASFDKKISAQADVDTTLTLNGNTLTGISNGAGTLVLGTDYTVTGNTVTILKSYLAEQSVGATSLTFTFSGGADQTLTITVNDTTPQNSTVSPNVASFDKKISAQADVDTTLTLNGNTLTGISNGAGTLVLGTDYTVTGNTVTILKSYLAEQSVGATSLTFTFSGGADQTLTITVNDTTPQNSTVSPNVASFDKKVSAQADVDTTLTLNGNTLTGISNGAEALVLGTDYTVTGNTVTILKSYLAAQSVGTKSLTFTFSGGENQTLTITVNDTTPQNSTISPNAASFDKKTSAQADVDTTLTLNGNTLIGISNGAEVLVLGTDYTVTGNTVTILKSYLAAQSVGTTSLTFTFSGGADQTLTITISDTTLPSYTVTYSGNGSTGGSVPTDSGFYEQGVSVLVSGNPGSLSKTGYTFAGWNTQADGNGTNYSAGATVTIGTANVTLYAKWISNIADLSDLTLSGNTLNPTFDAATTSYTVNVTTSMSSITVTATVRDAVDATVTATAYNNAGTITSGPIPLTSGAVSPSFPLNVGINLINLVVTAEDGTTKTYAITVNRASNNGSGGSIVPPTVPSEEQAPGTSTEEPPTDTSPTFAFSDIVGHWAETYIKQAAGIGIVTGYPDGTFKPNHTVTRAEFTVMLMNALKLPVEAAALSFTDTAKIGSWAQKAVAQAVQAGIINGYADGSFRPDAEITRAEMAMMLANALHLSLGANVATSFADDMDIPAWAKAAVSAIKTLGLIQGKSSNIFDPDASTTRAEAVTALMRMLAQQS